jgi:hypothetical protein
VEAQLKQKNMMPEGSQMDDGISRRTLDYQMDDGISILLAVLQGRLAEAEAEWEAAEAKAEAKEAKEAAEAEAVAGVNGAAHDAVKAQAEAEQRIGNLVLSKSPSIPRRLVRKPSVDGKSMMRGRESRADSPFLLNVCTVVTQFLQLFVSRSNQRVAMLLLILEDLHFFDPYSWHVIQALRRDRGKSGSGGRSSIVLVLTGREQEEGVSANPAANYTQLMRDPGVKVMTLGKLRGAEVLALSQELFCVRSLSAELSVFIQAKAEGNPAWVTELCHAAQAAGVVEIQSSSPSLAKGSPLKSPQLTNAPSSDTSPTLPPDASSECSIRTGVDLERVELLRQTMVGLFQGIFEHLEPTEQQTLKIAAVIGREFSLQMLYSVHPLTQALSASQNGHSNGQTSTGAEGGGTQALAQAQESIYEDLVALMRKGIVRERSYSGGLMSIMSVRNGNGNDSIGIGSTLSSTVKAERLRLRQQQEAETKSEREEREKCLMQLCTRQGLSTEGGCMHLTERLYCGLGWTPAQLEFHVDAEVEQRRQEREKEEQQQQRPASLQLSPSVNVRSLALKRSDSLSNVRRQSITTAGRPATTVEMNDDHFFFRQQSFAQAVYDMLSQAQRFQMHVKIAARYKECFEVGGDGTQRGQFGGRKKAEVAKHPDANGTADGEEQTREAKEEEGERAVKESEERVVATAQFAPLVAHHLASAGEKFQTDAADYFECAAEALLSGYWVSVMRPIDSPSATGEDPADESFEEDGVLQVARSVGLTPKGWPELAARERRRNPSQATASEKTKGHAGSNDAEGEQKDGKASVPFSPTAHDDPVLAHDLALMASPALTLACLPASRPLIPILSSSSSSSSSIPISIAVAEGLSVTTLWLAAALVLRAAVSLYNAVADGTANGNFRGSPPMSLFLNSPLEGLSLSPRSPRMIVTHPGGSAVTPKAGSHQRSHSGHQRKVSFSEHPTQLTRAHMLAADGMGLLRLWHRHVRRRQRREERVQRRREKRQRSLQRSLRQQRRSIHRVPGSSPDRSDGRTLPTVLAGAQPLAFPKAAATAAAAVAQTASLQQTNKLARNGGHRNSVSSSHRLGQHRPATVGLARRSAPAIGHKLGKCISPPQPPKLVQASRRRSSQGATLMSMLNIDSADSDDNADGEDTREAEESTDEDEDEDEDGDETEDEDDEVDEGQDLVGAECPECALWVMSSEELLQHCVKAHNYKDKYNYEHSDSHGGQATYAELEGGKAKAGEVEQEVEKEEKDAGADKEKSDKEKSAEGAESEQVESKAQALGQLSAEQNGQQNGSQNGASAKIGGGAERSAVQDEVMDEPTHRLPPTAEGTAEEEGAEENKQSEEEEDFFGGIRRASDMAMAAFAFSPGAISHPEDAGEEGKEAESFFSASSFSSFSLSDVFSPGSEQPDDAAPGDDDAVDDDAVDDDAVDDDAVDVVVDKTSEAPAPAPPAADNNGAPTAPHQRRQSAPVANAAGSGSIAPPDRMKDTSSIASTSSPSKHATIRARRATDFVSDGGGTSDATRLMALAQGFTGFGGSSDGTSGEAGDQHESSFPFPIKRASVVNAAATSSFDIFKLKVERKDGRIYVLKKRFSQFETLDEVVQADADRGAKLFPAASVFDFSMGFRLSAEQLALRRQQLHDFMQQPWSKLSDEALQRFNVFLMEGNDCAIGSGRKSDARRRPSS